MRRRACLLSLLAASPLATPAAWALPAARGETVPWPGVRLLDGQPWEGPQGRAAVLVFWSLGCAYCERHNAHVEKLWRAAQGRGLTVLGVVRASDAAAVARHAAAHGWSFPNTLDADALAAVLSRRRSVPMTVAVDRQGRLVEAVPGEMFEDDVLGYLRLAQS